MGTYALGMAGGSGARYGLRLMAVLADSGHDVHVVVSDAGKRVLEHEVGLVVGDLRTALLEAVPADARERVHCYDLRAVESLPASGSARIDGTVLCPCSMGTLARVAHGFSSNLLERAADVALKEGRRLIVVPRETPLSTVHLRNMLALAVAGGTILPAMPGFYHRPREVGDLVDFVVARILDQLEVEHELVERWKTPGEAGSSQWDEGEVGAG